MLNKLSRKLLAAGAAGAIAASLLAGGPDLSPVQASSHREAPLIVEDPTADNTDVYAFRSYEPGREGFVTLIANFIPFEEPSGGPHFYKFSDTALYEIKIDNTGDGIEDITYQFQFQTRFRNPNTVLGMAAPNEGELSPPIIDSLDDPDYNEPQFYSVRVARGPTNGLISRTALAGNLITPPNHIGARTTPNIAELQQAAIHPLPNGGRVFAGQREEGFYIDVGGVFDILNLRSITSTGGVDGLSGFNVNTIAIEVPIQALTRSGQVPSGPTASDAVIGVWATASRQTTTVIRPIAVRGRVLNAGPFRQVSRLGNPLVNEVVIPLGLKDTFNATTPAGDAQFAPFVIDPELPKLLRAVFGINIPPAPRNDLVAIFATGIPAGAVPGAPNYTTFLSDGRPHEMLRLNVAIAPTSAGASRLGLLGGDLAGFPNGRRVFDDVTDIALRAMAGGTPFTPATNVAPNNVLGDGVSTNDVPFLAAFPYLALPHSSNEPQLGKPHEHHVIDNGPAQP